MGIPRKALSLIALVAAVPLVLTACSSGGTDSGSDATSSGGDAGKTFTIWHYESDASAMGQAWNKAIEIFKTEHPDVTVNLEHQTFEQTQKNAKIFLSGGDVPDVMEFNKGNATAGVLASEELITPLTDEATSRGWDKILSPSLQTTAKYTENGQMGSGDWYGVPNYGEYVEMYYNKDMFAAQGLEIPKTQAELTAAMDKFVAAGITPLAMGGAEYPAGQLWYQLTLNAADRTFVDDYQLFKGDVDFHGKEMTTGADTFDQWVKKGYIASDSAGLKAEDMGVSFINGTYPMMFSGSWWFGRIKEEMKANWGTFLFPESKLSVGSSGNLWVVPESATNKDLAYDFIDITLRPEVQEILGQNGGLPVVGDGSYITDPATKEFTQNFNTINANDGLAFYPDWPVAGYYDVLVSGFQSLINQTKSPADVLTEIEGPYVEGRKDLQGN